MPYEVFICSHWLEDAPDTVQVYGNVDEVELRLNGRTLARRHPDNGPSTDYVPVPDGGNATHVAFPPFTFFGVDREPGELTAIGYKDGRPVAEHVVRTPSAPAALSVDYFEGGYPASRRDLLIVHVSLQDEQGTLCFGENGREVRLEVLRGGELRGPAQVTSEAGIASFLVATEDARTLEVRATSGGWQATKEWRLE